MARKCKRTRMEYEKQKTREGKDEQNINRRFMDGSKCKEE
jgi:hypothetical protein